MYFKINQEKVSEVGHFLQEKSDELDNLYCDVLTICNDIEDNYKSEDSTVYLAKFRNYIKDFVIENQDLREGGKVLDNTSILYDNQETSWANAVIQSDFGKRGED